MSHWSNASFYHMFSKVTIYYTPAQSYGQDESEWPLVEALPSYGRGRDAPGGRFSSLIFGTNLTDVVITGKYCNLAPSMYEKSYIIYLFDHENLIGRLINR